MLVPLGELRQRVVALAPQAILALREHGLDALNLRGHVREHLVTLGNLFSSVSGGILGGVSFRGYLLQSLL